MAFPQVQTYTPTVGPNNTGHAVAMAATVDVGDLLLELIAKDGTAATIVDSSGQMVAVSATLDNGFCRLRVFAEDAEGDEDGGTRTYTGGNDALAAQQYRITGHGGETLVELAVVDGNSTSPNPPSLTPSGGAKDYLWIVGCVVDNGGSSSVTGWPTNYSTGQNQSVSTQGGTEDVRLATCRRELNAASENPGAFTLSASRPWLAFTIAVPPVSVQVDSLSPADDATGVAIDAQLIVDFDQSVSAGTGNILVKRVSDDSTYLTIPVGDAQVDITADVMTVTPTTALEHGVEYYVQIAADVIVDWDGIDTPDWTFTVRAPVRQSLSPADDATDVSIDPTLTLTFDDPVQPGAGDIEVHRTSDDALIETIAIGAATFNGATVSFQPATLDWSEEYYILIDNGAIQGYAGISSTTEWSFTTEVQPYLLVSISPTAGATGVAVDADLVLTLDADALAGTGNVSLYAFGVPPLLVDQWAIGDAEVDITGAVVTITRSVPLSAAGTYYVVVDSGAILRLSDSQPFGGIPVGFWTFTCNPPLTAAYLRPNLRIVTG